MIPATVRLSPDGHELASLLPHPDDRFLLGITGAPGAGKSTLASAIVRLAGPGAVAVPMDGFHLADVELARRGLLDRKGAPETFDGWGYAALLQRARSEQDHEVMAPMFERDLEQPVAGAIPVPPSARLVVTEGNYLLVEEPPWTAVRGSLDAVWHVVTDETRRVERLVARHTQFGKSPAQARAWVERVDGPNAALVEAARERADLVLDVTDWSPGPAAGDAAIRRSRRRRSS